jgi:hypothetical protein
MAVATTSGAKNGAKNGDGDGDGIGDGDAEWLPDARFEIADGVIGEVLDTETVLLDLERGLYFRLNRTGTRLWESLEADGRLGVAEQALLEEFDVGQDELRRDMVALTSELQARGLITLTKP